MAMTFLLLISVFSISPISYAQDSTVAFAIGQGQGDKLLAELKGNLTALGYTIANDITEITESALTGVDVLVLGSVYGANFTQDEISAIASWFNEGEKGLWVCGDSDYYGIYLADNPNSVLEAVGSSLRTEATAVEDPDSNCGSAYRVVGNVVNSGDSEVSDIVTGVTQALFHGPDLVCGWGSYIPLDTETVENVFWVVKTSSAGVINDKDLTGPYAHDNGDVGSFALMAAEIYTGPNSNNKIIVTGASAYGNYQPIDTDEYYEVPLEGMTLVVNAIAWLAIVLAPAPPPALIPGFPIEAIIIGIAMTTVALLIFRKKPSVPTY